MTLEIYKLTIFFICIGIGVQLIEISGVVPETHTGYADKYANAGIFGTLTNMVSFMFGSTVPMDLTYLALSLATFGLLVFTLPFMLALFWYGYILGVDIIFKLPMPSELKIGFQLLLAIIYIIGYKQYKSNIPLKQF